MKTNSNQLFTFTNKSLCLCLHVLKISCLLLRVLVPLPNIIKCFSFRHKLHFLVTGLNGWAFARILQLMSKSSPLSFNPQTWPANLEDDLAAGSARSSICVNFPRTGFLALKRLKSGRALELLQTTKLTYQTSFWHLWYIYLFLRNIDDRLFEGHFYDFYGA